MNIFDLPIPHRPFPVPAHLKLIEGYASHMDPTSVQPAETPIRFLDATYPSIAAAFTAAMNPHALIKKMPFYKFVEQQSKTESYPLKNIQNLGKPKSEGGLIDLRPDWNFVCLGAMYDFTAQKFSATPEKIWLSEQTPQTLIAFNTIEDDFWGAEFTPGEKTACGRNVMGKILKEHHAVLMSGRSPGSYQEADWEVLQRVFLRGICRPLF